MTLAPEAPITNTEQYKTPAEMTYAERLAVTTSHAAVTHIMFAGERIPVEQFEAQTNMTVHEWQENKRMVQSQRTHCYVGGRALALVEFEATHNHITLGQE